jgi:2-oxoisovalerate dehydrogenase E1 component alpha subunit
MIRRELSRRATAFNRSFSRSAIRRLENLPTTNSQIVSELNFFNSVTGNDTQIPTFRVLDGVGKLLEGAVLPDVGVVLSIQFLNFYFDLRNQQIDEPFARRMYENMMLLPTLDNVLYSAQRQGKISFYVRLRYFMSYSHFPQLLLLDDSRK